MVTDGYEYSIKAGRKCSADLRAQMRALFNEHYGVWSEAAPNGKGGQRIGFTEKQLACLLEQDDSYALLAHFGSELIGYAIGVRKSSRRGPISWVTQLVVHGDHQNRRVSTTLLSGAWCFSTDFAWGLASANAKAVRALEAATLRKCDPHVIAANLEDLKVTVPQVATYLAGELIAGEAMARVNTGFFVSHDGLEETVASVSDVDRPWLLGPLPEGEEWLAVTFNAQVPRALTIDDVKRLSDAGGSVVAKAYDRMARGAAAQLHRWMGETAHEVDILVSELSLPSGAAVLDVGCGNGRHAIELARRGFVVTAIDKSPAWLEQARGNAADAGTSVDFVLEDVRELDLCRTFDAVISLYDVVGSFPADEDNQAILATIRRHLPRGGRFALSVMNRVVAENIATFKGAVAEQPELVQQVVASRTMQLSGNIWMPGNMLVDRSTGLVWRREQFDADEQLPVELLVCDRRYSPDELQCICEAAGLGVTGSRPVALGRWGSELDVADNAAKELLCWGRAM